MSVRSISKIVGPAGEALQEASQGAYNHARERACDLFDEASDCIRKNPVAIVAGALAIGVALGCLIMANRDSDEPDSLLEEAGECLSSSARRLIETLKFW